VHINTIQCSADVDKPDDSGNTPLHHAAALKKVDMAALLMAAGADPDSENCEWSESESDNDDEDADAETDEPAKSLDRKQPYKSGSTPRDMAESTSQVLHCWLKVDVVTTVILHRVQITLCNSCFCIIS
jgi:ankyrin repeat protein